MNSRTKEAIAAIKSKLPETDASPLTEELERAIEEDLTAAIAAKPAPAAPHEPDARKAMESYIGDKGRRTPFHVPETPPAVPTPASFEDLLPRTR